MTREVLPQRRMSQRLDFRVGKLVYAAGLGFYADGRLGEVFLSCGKSGTEADIIARDSAIAVSFALQHGCTVEMIRSAFTRDAQGEPEGPLGILFEILAEKGIT